MAYVALSRTKQLINLYLIDLDVTILNCDISCILEKNRLKNQKNWPEITKFNELPDIINKINKPSKYGQSTINTYLQTDLN